MRLNVVVISLTHEQRDAALKKSLTVMAFGRQLQLCRSLSNLPVTSHFGAEDRLTIVMGSVDAAKLRDHGECDVTVGFSKVRLEVTDGT